MQDNQTPTQVASVVLSKLEPILQQEKPDWVLVQGDTTTVAAAAIASFYARARVGHVEAGLRTGDRWQPFPEEINRRVAGVIADRHFAPTKRSRDNLLRENVQAETILVTGNPGIDALRWITAREPESPIVGDLLMESPEARTILVTAHRRENFGEGFERAMCALARLAERPDVELVCPVHRNPNVLGPAHELLGGRPNVHLLEPLSYVPFVDLLRRAYLLITDSGGIQEEAPSLGKAVLVLREKTERPEAVEACTVKLVGTDEERIVREATRLLDDTAEYTRMTRVHNPYGDGQASRRIAEILEGWFGGQMHFKAHPTS